MRSLLTIAVFFFSCQISAYDYDSLCAYDVATKKNSQSDFEVIEACPTPAGNVIYRGFTKKKLFEVYCGYEVYNLSADKVPIPDIYPAVAINFLVNKNCDFIDPVENKYSYIYIDEKISDEVMLLVLGNTKSLFSCISEEKCLERFVRSYGFLKSLFYKSASQLEELKVFLSKNVYLDSYYFDSTRKQPTITVFCEKASVCWRLEVDFRKMKLIDFYSIVQ